MMQKYILFMAALGLAAGTAYAQIATPPANTTSPNTAASPNKAVGGPVTSGSPVTSPASQPQPPVTPLNFTNLDTDRNGSLSTMELQATAGTEATLFGRIDTNGDGMISSAELNTWNMNSAPTPTPAPTPVPSQPTTMLPLSGTATNNASGAVK